MSAQDFFRSLMKWIEDNNLREIGETEGAKFILDIFRVKVPEAVGWVTNNFDKVLNFLGGLFGGGDGS